MTMNLFGSIININIVQISLHALLDLFKDIWDDGVFPPGWREATIPQKRKQCEGRFVGYGQVRLNMAKWE